MWRSLLTGIAMLAVLPAHAAGREDALRAYAAAIARADERNERIPGITAGMPDITEPEAYRAQRLRTSRIKLRGFKAGLTRVSAQVALGASGLVAGALAIGGEVRSPFRLHLADYRTLILECELAFELGLTIRKPVRGIDELKALVRRAAPAIEAPDSAFAPAASINARDMIAANVGASRYFTARLRPVRALSEPDSIPFTLTRNGMEIARGNSGEAVGSHWQSLLTTVNILLDAGYRLRAGQIVLTGAVIQVPGVPGDYVADFGDWGQIAFTVSEKEADGANAAGSPLMRVSAATGQ